MTLKTDTEMLSHGRCNRMSTSLEMCVRLELNAKALAWSLNVDWVLASRLAIWVNVDSCITHVSTAIVLVCRWLCSNIVADKTVTEMM